MQKNFQLTSDVLKSIELHHEDINGFGYPSGLKLEKDVWAWQLLPLANKLDYLRSVEKGDFGKSFKNVFLKELKENAINPSFDQKLILKLQTLLWPHDKKISAKT